MLGYEDISSRGKRLLVSAYEGISAWGKRVLVLRVYEDISEVLEPGV